jgi:hypothetical protein
MSLYEVVGSVEERKQRERPALTYLARLQSRLDSTRPRDFSSRGLLLPPDPFHEEGWLISEAERSSHSPILSDLPTLWL